MYFPNIPPATAIKDPIHGYIYLSELEKKIIDLEAFQRLHRIKQLAGSEYVYPSANHTRFEHALGVMHLAGDAGYRLNLQEEITYEDTLLLRLAGLLHDVGHGPFSHVFETILSEEQLTHEDFTIRVILETEIGDFIEEEGFSKHLVAELAAGRLKNPPFMREIISSTIDVDKQDFLVRDSYHTGAAYGYVDMARLRYLLGVIDNHIAVDIRGLPTLEMFVLARMQSFRTIYFHATARAAQLLLGKALQNAKEVGLFDFNDIQNYLRWDDYSIWHTMLNIPECEPYITQLKRRELPKLAYEIEILIADRPALKLLTHPSNRASLEEQIANESGCPQVFIDTANIATTPFLGKDPVDVQLFKIDKITKEKIPLKLTDVSRLISVIKGIMTHIRVYAPKKYRSAVKETAERILGVS